MRGPKPNYARNGVKGSNYGPTAGGLTEGTPYTPPADLPCTGVPQPICVGGLAAHISSDLSFWLTPQLLYVGSWADDREPTYFRIVIDPGGVALTSPNLAWDEYWQVTPGCPWAGGVEAVRLFAGNDCGEDFCDTNIIFQDEDAECAG